MNKKRVLSLLLLYFLFVLLFAVWQLSRTPKQHRGSELVVAEYTFFLAATLSGAFTIEWFGKDLARLTQKVKSESLAAFGLLLLVVLSPLGMHQFGGYDHSTLILSGWVVRSGLVPFRDIPCTVPPLFVMGSTAAMTLFGIHWWGFVALATTFAAVTFVWLVSQLTIIGLPLVLATGLALVAELSTMMVGGYWWYNPVSSIAVVLILASSLASLRTTRASWPWVSLAASLCLLLLVKPNTWPVGACVAVLLLARTRQSRIKAAIAAVSGAMAAVSFCFAYGFSPADVLRAYGEVASTRGTPFSLVVFSDFLPLERTFLLLIISLIAALFLFLLGGARHEWRTFWREYTCCVAAGVASLWMTFTDYELKTSDLTPLLLAIAMVAFQPWSRRQFTVPAKRVLTTLVLGFVIASAYWSITRFRVRGIGEGMFFQYPADIRISSGFFEGLWTGPRLVRVLSETQDALRDHPGNVFFGPRMEFLYTVFSRPPGKGLPLFWHAGSAYALADTPAIVDAFLTNRFETLIFLRDDFTRMPDSLLAEISRSYESLNNYDELTVFRLNRR